MIVVKMLNRTEWELVGLEMDVGPVAVIILDVITRRREKCLVMSCSVSIIYDKLYCCCEDVHTTLGGWA